MFMKCPRDYTWPRTNMRSTLNGFGHTGAKGLTCCNPMNGKKSTLLGFGSTSQL